MSIKSIFKAAIAYVSTLLVTMGIKRSTDPLPELPDTNVTEQALDHAIETVNNIRLAMASPAAIILENIIPTTIDDEIRTGLVKNLPLLIAGLTFVKNTFLTADKVATPTELLAPIKFSDKPDQDAFYHALAARILMILSDGKITWSEAVQTVEFYFKNMFGKQLTA